MVRQQVNNQPSSENPRTLAINLGQEIRTIRKARGVTLKQLSHEAGCSAAYLSRIERGEAKISLELMTEIGRVLAVDPKWFFPGRSGSSEYEKSYVVRADERRPLSQLYTRSTDELGFSDELLSSSLAGDCYMMLTRFPAQSDADTESATADNALQEGYAYEGEQHGVVIQGCMKLILDNEELVLHAGDSFSYPTTIPHRMINGSADEAIVIITMTPVRINW